MSGARRLLLSGIALTALLAVVALASHAHRPGGGGGGGSAETPKLFFEYGASVLFILFPFGVLAVIWVASLGRRQKLLEGGGRVAVPDDPRLRVVRHPDRVPDPLLRHGPPPPEALASRRRRSRPRALETRTSRRTTRRPASSTGCSR